MCKHNWNIATSFPYDAVCKLCGDTRQFMGARQAEEQYEQNHHEDYCKGRWAKIAMLEHSYLEFPFIKRPRQSASFTERFIT